MRESGNDGYGREQHVPLAKEVTVRLAELLPLAQSDHQVRCAGLQTTGREFAEPVVVRPFVLGESAALFFRITHRCHEAEQPAVKLVMSAQVTEHLGLGDRYPGASPGQPASQVLERPGDLVIHG